VILDGVDDSLYSAYAANFPSVGRLGAGSGFLISPNWVMTAAHVPTTSTSTFQLGAQNVSIVESVTHPKWSNINFGYDIALHRLATPIVGVPIARIYTGTNELGATLSISGHGKTGVGSTGILQDPRKFLAGTNIVDAIISFTNGAQEAALVTDFDAPADFNPNGTFNTLGSHVPTSLEYQLADGDSGGAAFIFENGEWYVAGINSGVASQRRVLGSGSDRLFGYGAVSIMTRVSSYQDFIASVSGVPEPGSLALLVCCVGVMGFVKRKLFVNLPGHTNR
jgi:hypothetical protein